MTVITIQRGDKTIDSPPPDTEMREGDTLIVVGTREECENFEALLARDA